MTSPLSNPCVIRDAQQKQQASIARRRSPLLKPADTTHAGQPTSDAAREARKKQSETQAAEKDNENKKLGNKDSNLD